MREQHIIHMSDQDKILQFLALSGPSLPTKVARHIQSDILFASAHLSDLKAQGKVRISHLKVGGSPLYYLPGQEDQLDNFASGNLNPKDLLVLQTLRDKKILREADLDLLSKVALRSLDDFAIPLHVTINEKKELFWKWHLLSDEETNFLITSLLQPQNLSLPQETPFHEETVSPVQEPIFIPNLSISFSEQPSATLNVSSSPPLKEKIISPKRPYKHRESIPRTINPDAFVQGIEHYFHERDITVEQKETLRRHAELNFIVKVPSVIGRIMYFCKAKSKQKCDEKDLSTAYFEAKMKKFPLLFLYSGELHKKAQELIESGALENTIIKRISNE